MASKLIPTQFKVTNFRNIDDSGWIKLERVTALVGRNESGKTALLKALHKFNPASQEPYNPQREFPRDRFNREFHNGADWPVCAVEFELTTAFRSHLRETLGADIPTHAICTRYYDGSLKTTYNTSVSDDPLLPADLLRAIESFSKQVRRLTSPDPTQETLVAEGRKNLLSWATNQKEKVAGFKDLKNPDGMALLKETRDQLNMLSNSLTADIIEPLLGIVENLLTRAQTTPMSDRLKVAIESAMPVFIYFENYGILDSAVYLPRLLDDLTKVPEDPRVRTINAMFKHVTLDAKTLHGLGIEEAAEARRKNSVVTDEMIRRDQNNKELRAIKLNSASIDITKRFGEWFHQRRHNITYQADGDYFRIFVSDDRRPDVNIELESRSKGFQWFFSFYLVFLVESEEGHKDAVLLLDEPGLHLHPTAQQELITFFEEISSKNMLVYSTHSPFLIDGEHIHRVRPVTEDHTGHSRVSANGWPADRETIFPLQAAAGYAMVRGLFFNKKVVLVEGIGDYIYLMMLNLICRAANRITLNSDVYITPCGGTKNVGYIASLFLGQEIRPLVMLDADDAGRSRRESLLKELYKGETRSILILSEVLNLPECEIEDILGEAVILPMVCEFLGREVVLGNERPEGSLVDKIMAALTHEGIKIPEGWKPEIARRLAMRWATIDPALIPCDVLDRAEILFKTINGRFEEGIRP